MKKMFRLIGSLFLIFVISFFLSGGKMPFFSAESLPVPNKETITEPLKKAGGLLQAGQNLPSKEVTIGNTFDRLRRIAFPIEAANEKLRRTNYTKIENISDTMKKAIISVEDNRFYNHHGFDFTAIIRATLVNIQSGEIEEGASTITQQLVKNLYLSDEQTMVRKIEELIMSLNLETRCSKDEILELYLNSIYFGSGYYGITDAAKGYFGKTPDNLNLPEAAMLAGLPNAPSLYSPYEDFKMAKKRQFIVLDTMVKNGYIDRSLAEDAKRAPIYLAH